MPGFLSNMFGGDDEGGVTGSSDEQTVELGQELELSPEIHLSIESGGTYQGLDGSTNTWAREDSVDLTVDTTVATNLIATVATEEESFG